MKQEAVRSLKSDFYAKASPSELRAYREDCRKKQTRNKANQLAIGRWHNESRGKMVEVPFPERRTH